MCSALGHHWRLKVHFNTQRGALEWALHYTKGGTSTHKGGKRRSLGNIYCGCLRSLERYFVAQNVYCGRLRLLQRSGGGGHRFEVVIMS